MAALQEIRECGCRGAAGGVVRRSGEKGFPSSVVLPSKPPPAACETYVPKQQQC